MTTKHTGIELFKVCQKFAEAKVAQADKDGGKLLQIATSIKALDKTGHTEFRAEIEKARQHMIVARQQGGAYDTADYQGYAMASYTVLLANWKAISKACEIGLDIMREDGKPKAWSVLYKDAVTLNNGLASNAGAAPVGTIVGAQMPAPKKKAGRAPTPLIDKAIAAAEALKQDNIEAFKRFVTILVMECKEMEKEKQVMQRAPTPTIGAAQVH